MKDRVASGKGQTCEEIVPHCVFAEHDASGLVRVDFAGSVGDEIILACWRRIVGTAALSVPIDDLPLAAPEKRLNGGDCSGRRVIGCGVVRCPLDAIGVCRGRSGRKHPLHPVRLFSEGFPLVEESA